VPFFGAICYPSKEEEVKRAPDKFRLVYIEWEDSHGCSNSWEFIDQCKPAVAICQSVGWLIHDDKVCKIVVPHLLPYNDNGIRPQGMGDMTIPTSAVRKLVDLKLPVTTRKKR